MNSDSLPVERLTEVAVLTVKLDAVKEEVLGIKRSVDNLSAAMSMLVRLEESQRDVRNALDRAFTEIKVEREKVASLQAEMPGYRALRRWVIGSVAAGLGMLGIALFNVLIIQPLYMGYTMSAAQVLKSQSK